MDRGAMRFDFQRDLQMYEELPRAGTLHAAGAASVRSSEPSVCGPVAPSAGFAFMEKARLAASQALTGIRRMAAQM